IVGADDPEVSVGALRRVEKDRRRAGGGERGGDLSPHEPRLSDASHDDAPRRARDRRDGARELIAQTFLDRRERFTLESNDAAAALYDLFGAHGRRAWSGSERSATYCSVIECHSPRASS